MASTTDLARHLRRVLVATGFKQKEHRSGAIRVVEDILKRTNKTYFDIFSTRRRTCFVKIRFAKPADAQDTMQACRENPERLCTTKTAVTTQIKLSMERKQDEARRARPTLRAAWLLREAGVAGAHGEISSGREYDEADTLLATADRIKHIAILTQEGRCHAGTSDRISRHYVRPRRAVDPET